MRRLLIALLRNDRIGQALAPSDCGGGAKLVGAIFRAFGRCCAGPCYGYLEGGLSLACADKPRTSDWREGQKLRLVKSLGRFRGGMFCRFFSYAFFLLHRNRIGRSFWSLIPILLLFGQALTKYSYSRQHLPRAASYLSTTPHWSPATLRASPRLPRRPPRDAPDSSTQPTPRRPPPDPRGSRLLFWIDVIAKFRDERNQYCFRTHPFVCWVPTCLFSSRLQPTDRHPQVTAGRPPFFRVELQHDVR